MKFLAILVIILMAALLGWGAYSLIKKNQQLKSQVDELTLNFKKLQNENSSLGGQIEYFKNPQNLLKQLKQQFNYKESGEGLIILVPHSATSTVNPSP